MAEEQTDDKAQTSTVKYDRRRTSMTILGVVIAVLFVAAAILGYKVLSLPGYRVPENVLRDTPHTIFVPKRLPADYKVVDGSFSLSEGGLIFQANDSSGSSIAFAEQKVPKDFNFEQFYQENVAEAKKLEKTPYPSVIGKLSNDNNKLLLSIVADDTWILVSTAAPLGEQDLTTIARNIKKY